MSKNVTYVVLVKAVSISTGRLNPQTKRDEVVRVLKDQTIDAPPDNPTIMTLLSMKSIRPADEATGKERVTPRVIVRAFKEDVTAVIPSADPAKNPDIPLDAPNPITDPDLLVQAE